MEITNADIIRTYDSYYRNSLEISNFESNLIVKGNSGIKIINSIRLNQKNNQKNYLLNKNNINKYIFPFLNKKKVLNDQYATIFFSCIETYFNKGFYDGYLINEVVPLLLSFYQKDSEKYADNIILCEYYLTISLINNNPLAYRKDISNHFENILSKLDYIYKTNSKLVINALLVSILENMKFEAYQHNCSLETMFSLYNLSLKYYNDEKILSLHGNKIRLSNMLSEAQLMICKLTYHPNIFVSNITPLLEYKELYYISETKYLKKTNNSNDKLINEYQFLISKYINKKIIKNDLRPIFEKIIAQHFDKKFIKQQYELFLQILPNITFFLDNVDLLKKAKKKILDFIEWLSYYDYNSIVDLSIHEFVIPFLQSLNDSNILEIIYEITIRKYLYFSAHSLMVGQICKEIAQTILDLSPELFVGYRNYKLNDVLNHKKEIIDEMNYAGLYHDIGKTYFDHQLCHLLRQNSSKEESSFEYHVDLGSKITDVVSDKLFYDVVLGHHKSYDGKSGFNKEFNNKNSSFRIAIDIVKIADYIENESNIVHHLQLESFNFDDLIKKLNDFDSKNINKKIVSTINLSPILKTRLKFLTENAEISFLEKVCDYLLNRHFK